MIPADKRRRAAPTTARCRGAMVALPVLAGLSLSGCATSTGVSGADPALVDASESTASHAVGSAATTGEAPSLAGPEPSQLPPIPAHRAVPLGASTEGRPIDALTCGHGPFRIYLIGGIHGDEIEGRDAIGAIARRFSSPPLADLVTLRLVPDLNPDGTSTGRRGNARGVDLNRNWPASNFRARRGHGPEPLSERESSIAHMDLTSFDPDLIVVLHSARSGPFVNYDGPAEPYAVRFAEAAAARGDGRWRVEPDMGYATPGSMGSYWGRDRQVPILTVESRRGESAMASTAQALVDGLVALGASGAAPGDPTSTPSGRAASHHAVAGE